MTPRPPIEGPQLWRGEELADRDEWILQLTEGHRRELERAAEGIRARRVTLEEATAADFSLPELRSVLERTRRELRQGRGFILLRGLPVGQYSSEELGIIFWGLGSHLGVCVSQSVAGDRLGHVIDRGAKDRYYTAGGEIEFHCDPVDVVGLLCLRRSWKGGASRIVSTAAVHNAVLAERPQLLEALYRGYFLSRRAEGTSTLTPHRVPVFADGADGPESYLLPIAIREAFKDGLTLEPGEREALEYVQSVAARPGVYLDMNFQEGDIQFLNNRRIFHARTDYVDPPDPTQKRHLLRLWLMMPDWAERHPSMRLFDGNDRAGGGIRTAASQARS